MLQPQIPWSQQPGSPPTRSVYSKGMPRTPGTRRLSLGPANPPFLATRYDTALTLCHFSCVRWVTIRLGQQRGLGAGVDIARPQQYKEAPYRPHWAASSSSASRTGV